MSSDLRDYIHIQTFTNSIQFITNSFELLKLIFLFHEVNVIFFVQTIISDSNKS